MEHLSVLDHACTTAIATLHEPYDDHPPLDIVLADLDALLALIYNLVTKLALALKPPAPAYTASVPLSRDLAHHTSALAHCARLFHDGTHGAAIAKDVRSRVTDIIHALRALVRTFLDNASGQEYLLRTGALHDLITSARSPAGIPKDNRAAVCRFWKSDRDSLEDNFVEITRMIDDPGLDPDPDDGWNELGLGDVVKLNACELSRVNNVHQILRLTTLLHKRILVDLLSHPSPAPVAAFDSLLMQSNLLLSTSDDLVAALYSPQDPALVRTEILQLADIVASLKTQIPIFLSPADDLTNQLHALNVEGPSPSRKKADQKWFDTCVDQITRLCASTIRSIQSDRHSVE